MVRLGWLGLVEFDVDRPRSRATDGHSVNATRKTQNHAVVRHKRSFFGRAKAKNYHGRVLWAWARHTPPLAVAERASFFVFGAGGALRAEVAACVAARSRREKGKEKSDVSG